MGATGCHGDALFGSREPRGRFVWEQAGRDKAKGTFCLGIWMRNSRDSQTKCYCDSCDILPGFQTKSPLAPHPHCSMTNSLGFQTKHHHGSRLPQTRHSRGFMTPPSWGLPYKVSPPRGSLHPNAPKQNVPVAPLALVLPNKASPWLPGFMPPPSWGLPNKASPWLPWLPPLAQWLPANLRKYVQILQNLINNVA